jgi:cytochrome c peroxidase
MRQVAGALAAVALASAAMAQPPDPLERYFFTPAEQAVGQGPGDPLVLLGQELFFDARLSGSGTTACASCHDPGHAYAEPRRVGIADNGRPVRRNAPSLLDVALLPRLMWDGRFHSLEEQALSPFHMGEMGIGVGAALRRVRSDRRYVRLFHAAFGRPPTAEGAARALAAFQRTLASGPSRVDRFLLNGEPALTPLEHRGLQIFTGRAGCSNCHRPFPLRRDGSVHRRPLFTDFRFHNLGVGYRPGGFADSGRYALSRIDAAWGAFRTPSLRNVAMSPPYMHDGSLATLEEVVAFYSAGGVPNPNLSPLIGPLHLHPYEQAALTAFLRALTDEGYEE